MMKPVKLTETINLDDILSFYDANIIMTQNESYSRWPFNVNHSLATW